MYFYFKISIYSNQNLTFPILVSQELLLIKFKKTYIIIKFLHQHNKNLVEILSLIANYLLYIVNCNIYSTKLNS